MTDRLYENSLLYIEIEPSQVPWLKIFVKKPTKELSSCDKKTKAMLYQTLDTIEKHMLQFFKPTKINIASFGNYKPQVHFHIMARFKTDDYYPEPMWGAKQRNDKLHLQNIDEFYNLLEKYLSMHFV
ncbi:MAG: HIT family protein [Epsilonproteobacteria bacterium]|nr:MAG: HIT family protein [Campylobacterota bacterium]